MATAGTTLADRVAQGLRSPNVAAQAGIASSTWASTDTPRVFRGLGGYLNGRSRGRLPFIEFDVTSQGFTQDTREGGTLTSRVLIRAHCGGRDLEAAANMLEAILAAALACIRDESADNYMALGDDELGQLIPGPWGLSRDATILVQHTFGRNDYEVYP